MLEVEPARRLVLEHAACKPAERVPLAQSLGLVLAESVTSDVDSPPHDKALVDGYAVLAQDLETGRAELRVLEEVTAGGLPTLPLVAGAATRIMTGAPIPANAEAVVMVEETTTIPMPDGNSGVRIETARFRAGQNIMRRGASLKKGQQVLAAGREIRAIEIGLLAEVGRAEVLATPRVQVAVLATGNELVPAQMFPSAGQIRNSNGPMLAALVANAGGISVDLGIARDDERELTSLVTRGLAADVLILSGGVSAGVLDLVPGVLAKLGVRQVFHKVSLKPGKPIWFGVLPTALGEKLVFGLPGNPVGALVCFELFVRPALAKLAGRDSWRQPAFSARLSGEFEHRGDRPSYLPARRMAPVDARPEAALEMPIIELLDWRGSADLRTLTDADVLACFPSGDGHYDCHDVIQAIKL